MPALTRHPIYYAIVGYSLYAVGGGALFFNATCTQIAFTDSNTPALLAWFFALLFSCISIGIGLFLSSPDTWGEIWLSFLGTTKTAGVAGEQRAPKWLMAVLLAIVLLLIVGFFVFVYCADWISTWDFLSSWEISGIYLLSACLALIVGPETCFVLANAVLRQGKRVNVAYLKEGLNADPEIEYLKTVHAGRVKMAREAGLQDATGHPQ